MSSEPSNKQLRTDDAYQEIRKAIIRGKLLPRERLVEVELAERFSISRTPIREVLQRLSVEGLIVRGRRGWRVREHEPEDVRELYEVRCFLEGAASFLAASRGTDEALQLVADVHRSLVADGAPGLRDRLVEGNVDFHEAILKAAENERLTHLVQLNRDYAFNHRVAHLYTDSEAFEVVEQHQKIVDALLARDAPLAEEMARKHMTAAWELTVAKGLSAPV